MSKEGVSHCHSLKDRFIKILRNNLGNMLSPK